MKKKPKLETKYTKRTSRGTTRVIQTELPRPGEGNIERSGWRIYKEKSGRTPGNRKYKVTQETNKYGKTTTITAVDPPAHPFSRKYGSTVMYGKQSQEGKGSSKAKLTKKLNRRRAMLESSYQTDVPGPRRPAKTTRRRGFRQK